MPEVSATDAQPRAQRALAASTIHELRDLQVDRHNGVLMISGVVSSFYHKQLAQEIVRSVCPEIAFDFVNSIRVR